MPFFKAKKKVSLEINKINQPNGLEFIIVFKRYKILLFRKKKCFTQGPCRKGPSKIGNITIFFELHESC